MTAMTNQYPVEETLISSLSLLTLTPIQKPRSRKLPSLLGNLQPLSEQSSLMLLLCFEMRQVCLHHRHQTMKRGVVWALLTSKQTRMKAFRPLDRSLPRAWKNRDSHDLPCPESKRTRQGSYIG